MVGFCGSVNGSSYDEYSDGGYWTYQTFYAVTPTYASGDKELSKSIYFCRLVLCSLDCILFKLGIGWMCEATDVGAIWMRFLEEDNYGHQWEERGTRLWPFQQLEP